MPATSPRRLTLLLSLCALLGVAAATRGEDLGDDLTPEQREQLYRRLDDDVAQLARFTGALKTVVKLVSPAVVHIDAEKDTGPGAKYGRAKLIEEAGSGVIIEINKKQYVLTNRHVIKDAELANIKVNLADQRQISPTRVWQDDGTDIAVMAVNAPRLVSARIGDSEKIEIGDIVLAVGSPFGLSRSVTFGIISAKGRRDLELGDDSVRFQDFMQTDAAINPGNSGGPLISLRGEVIGINTAIASNSGGNEGIGFTIPINMAMTIARQLIDRGAVTRAFLGVTLDSKFNAASATKLGLPRLVGARITGITPNSPAAEHKLRIDDVVLDFDGVRVQNDSHLVNVVSLTPIGKDIPVTIFREGKALKLTVKVGDRAAFEPK